MKKVLIILFIVSPLLAQFTSKDYDLVKSNFYRTFNKNIIENYLNSSNADSVKAALLSVSHSGDTSWIKEIIKLDFNKYGDYIAFAIGQLGESQISAEFLFDRITNLNSNKFIKECYEAFGNTADSAAINSLFDNINEINIANLHGLPYALNNFNSRFPIPHKDEFIKYLIDEIAQSNSNERKFDALFVLYRFGGSKDTDEALINILKQRDGNINSLKYYALGNLRRISYFPDDSELFNNLINDADPRIRIEAARTLCFYKFTTFNEIENYISLLEDENPSAARQTAISISNINCDDELKRKLYDKIYDLINNTDLTNNTRGELFVNYCNYKKENYLDLIEEFEDEIDNSFIYRILSTNLSFPEKNFDYIKDNIKGTSETDFLNILTAALPLQDSLSSNSEFNKFLLSILNSSSKIGITLVSVNLDSAIISQNINAIQQIVLEQVFKYYNNQEYSESLITLYELAKKISDDFAKEFLQVCETSAVNWLKTFAEKNLDKEFIPEETKDIDFDKLWESAFKYSKAKVNTNKGSFIIEFSPQAAPLSVGNFCYLISLNYYNNCVFHRVVPNFVIQTGDPGGTGWGGPGYEIVSEFSLQPFDEAYVGMASSGKDTEGSQWFVMHSSFPHLDWRYTNFGKVIEGMDVVNMIDQKDKIIDIELIK